MSSRHVCLRCRLQTLRCRNQFIWRPFNAAFTTISRLNIVHEALRQPEDQERRVHQQAQSSAIKDLAKKRRSRTRSRSLDDGRDEALERAFTLGISKPAEVAPEKSQKTQEIVPSDTADGTEPQSSVYTALEQTPQLDERQTRSVPDEHTEDLDHDALGTTPGTNNQPTHTSDGIAEVATGDADVSISKHVIADGDTRTKRGHSHELDRLTEAIRSASLGKKHAQLYAMWQTWANRLVSSPKEGSLAPIHDASDVSTPIIYNRFMSAFDSLNRTDAVIEVWNHMITQGIKPNLHLYSMMLVALGKHKDAEALRNTWRSVRQSGLPLDLQIWSIYVNGLMRSQAYKDGLETLDSLRAEILGQPRRTKKAVEIYIQARYKVTTIVQVVNAALGGLSDRQISRNQKGRPIDQVLSWADRLGVKPDTDTFNNLLTLRGQERNPAELWKTWQHMQAADIVPNGHTYSLFVENLLQLDMTPEERFGTVFRVLSTIEAKGPKRSPHIYGVCIDALLNRYNDLASAQAVLSHMQGQDITISPVIYTLMFNYYFRQEQLDIYSIEALWVSVRRDGAHKGDTRLYDQIISLYAKAGYTSQALSLLQDMSMGRHVPAWTTLSAVVSALVRADQWLRIREIVHDAKQMRGVIPPSSSFPKYAQQDEQNFWRYVESLEIPN